MIKKIKAGSDVKDILFKEKAPNESVFKALSVSILLISSLQVVLFIKAYTAL